MAWTCIRLRPPGGRRHPFDASRNSWPTVTRGRTKTEVKDKLRAKHQELAAGVRTPASYTVEQCLMDWLETLNTQAETTVTGYRIMTRHLVELIGNVKLTELKSGTSTSCLAGWPIACRPGALGWPG